MIIKKDNVTLAKVCCICKYGHRKINVAPCNSCIKITDKVFNYTNFLRCRGYYGKNT